MVQVRASNIDMLWSTKNVSGKVVFAYDPKDEFLHRRVLFVPLRGWHSDPKGPEAKYVQSKLVFREYSVGFCVKILGSRRHPRRRYFLRIRGGTPESDHTHTEPYTYGSRCSVASRRAHGLEVSSLLNHLNLKWSRQPHSQGSRHKS